MNRRLLIECGALTALSLACAWASNALAGPARHLSWFPREVRAVPRPPDPAAAAGATAKVEPPAASPAAPKAEPKKGTPAAAAAPQAVSPADLQARFPPLLDAPQAEVSAEDAKWLHDHGALFIDARRSAFHAQGHIAGSKVISVWEDGLAEKVEQLSMFTPDLKAPVVIYCSGGDCKDSHLLAEKLWLAGFRNLRIYVGGFPDWDARRWPIAKGNGP